MHKKSPTPRFSCAQVNYKVDVSIQVDTGGLSLDDSAFVTVQVFYRPKPHSPPVASGDKATPSNGVWKDVQKGLSFTPTRPGIYSIVLTAFTTDASGQQAASIATFKIDRLTVVD